MKPKKQCLNSYEDKVTLGEIYTPSVRQNQLTNVMSGGKMDKQSFLLGYLMEKNAGPGGDDLDNTKLPSDAIEAMRMGQHSGYSGQPLPRLPLSTRKVIAHEEPDFLTEEVPNTWRKLLGLGNVSRGGDPDYIKLRQRTDYNDAMSAWANNPRNWQSNPIMKNVMDIQYKGGYENKALDNLVNQYFKGPRVQK